MQALKKIFVFLLLFMEVLMRKFFFAFAIVAVFFALSAQDNSNDLYQQYLNQYRSEERRVGKEC